jgi:hypothetical protein
MQQLRRAGRDFRARISNSRGLEGRRRSYNFDRPCMLAPEASNANLWRRIAWSLWFWEAHPSLPQPIKEGTIPGDIPFLPLYLSPPTPPFQAPERGSEPEHPPCISTGFASAIQHHVSVPSANTQAWPAHSTSPLRRPTPQHDAIIFPTHRRGAPVLKHKPSHPLLTSPYCNALCAHIAALRRDIILFSSLSSPFPPSFEPP